MPQRQFHNTRSVFAPCHGGPSADEIAREELHNFRKLEQELCELRSLLPDLLRKTKDEQLDPATAKKLSRHLEAHKEHRLEDYRSLLKDASRQDESIRSRIRECEMEIPRLKGRIPILEKQLTELKELSSVSLKRLNELKEVDTNSEEFLDRESTSRFAPK